MHTIIINALNNNSAGGKSIFLNLLRQLKNDESYTFVILTSQNIDELRFENDRVNYKKMSSWYSKGVLAPIVYRYLIGKIIFKLNADLVINLGDLLIETTVKQVYWFDWAYATYPESLAWSRMSWFDYLNRKLKLYLIKKHIKKVHTVIAQTESNRKRLQVNYGISNIIVIPNAVSVDHYKSESAPHKKHAGTINLMYLTRYYSHKNLEVILKVADTLIARNIFNISITLTVDKNQSRDAYNFIKQCAVNGRWKVIKNIGAIPMSEVPTAFANCHGLLMPTLLESFSGTYVEAMYHEKPIFTSDLDFARDVCANGAYYFDPLSELDIVDTILSAFEDLDDIQEKIDLNRMRLKQFKTWDNVGRDVNDLIRNILNKY